MYFTVRWAESGRRVGHRVFGGGVDSPWKRRRRARGRSTRDGGSGPTKETGSRSWEVLEECTMKLSVTEPPRDSRGCSSGFLGTWSMKVVCHHQIFRGTPMCPSLPLLTVPSPLASGPMTKTHPSTRPAGRVSSSLPLTSLTYVPSPPCVTTKYRPLSVFKGGCPTRTDSGSRRVVLVDLNPGRGL